jgi:type I restriction enzyme S subunit
MKKKLGDVFEIGSGGTPSKTHPEYYGGDIPWVKTGDLKSEYLYEVEDFITEEGLNNSSAKMYESDTVLIAMYGATIGATSILNFPACTNQACAAFKKSEEILPEYLYFFLRSKKEKFVNDGVGGTQPNISAGYLKKVQIEVRSLDEQSEIINVLDKVNRIIDERTKELAALDDLIKARFVELFGEPILNPKEWKIVTIGDIALDVRYGTSRPAVEGGKYPYLRMNNLTIDGHLDLTDLKYIDIPEDELEKCVVRKGDILFNRTNSLELVGKTAVFDLCEDMVIAGYIIRVRLNNKMMLPEIFSQYMNHKTLKKILRGMAKGAVNQANINAKELQSIKIYVPNMKLQDEFVTFVNQVNKSKVEIQQALEKTQLLFDSLMQQYFG